jgi:alpha-N-arabinofuranosidase
LFRIASGASGNDYHWTETLMKNIPHKMLEGVALHHYAVIDWSNKGSAKDFDEATYFKTMKQALLMDEFVTKHSAIMDKYDPKNKVAMVVDEWGGWYDVEPGTNGAFLFQQNTMRDAVLAGSTLNIFNNNCRRVKMANLAQTVNVLQAVILTKERQIILTPTYHVMEMYKVHQDALLLPIDIRTENYTIGKESLPAISASASKDKTGKVHISLVNIDASKAHPVNINLANISAKSIKGRILTSATLQDHNTFEAPNKIQPKTFNQFTLSNSMLNVTIPPFSVVVLSLE